MKFEIFVHGVDVIENVVYDTRNDSLQIVVVENALTELLNDYS